MLTEENVIVKIITNPNVKANELDFNFEVPQKLGGLKRSVTVKRNLAKKLVKSKTFTYDTLSTQLGISEYNLKRFINKDTLNPIASKAVYDKVFKADLKSIDIETESERFKGINKMNIRYLFIKYIIASKKLKGRFFSLPSETCTFENELNIQVSNKFHYECAEHNKDIWLNAKQTIAKLKLCMQIHLGKSREVLLNKTSEYFSHIFADYCGTFESHENEVRHIFTNNLVRRNGLIGLTFNTRVANKNVETCIEYVKSLNNAFKLDIEPSTVNGIKAKLLSYIGDNYKIVEFVEYYDNGHMVFVLIKRVK